MERNEFALAGALLLSVCCVFMIGLAFAGAALPRPDLWAAWVQALGSILAVIAAAMIGRWQVQRDIEIRTSHQREQWRIAGLEIAAYLRVWLRDAAKAVSDNKIHAETDGRMGREWYGVPDFGFASHLDRVSAMRPELAVAVFDLLQRADRLRDDIAAEWDSHGSDDDVYHVMMRDLPTVFFRGRAVYRKIAQEVGLSDKPNRRWEVQVMHASRNKQRKIDAANAADHSIPSLD